jgi:hypothetical protein
MDLRVKRMQTAKPPDRQAAKGFFTSAVLVSLGRKQKAEN